MNIPKDKYIRVNQLRLHYLDWGKGGNKTILLLHGFMSHAHMWDNLATELSARFHVLALDQRGHGDSEWSKDAYYSIDNHFSDISVFIESLELEKVIILGHSMGGRNAMFYAACVPEKVERLILVDARLGNTQDASKALRRQLTSLPLNAKSMDEVTEAIRSLYPYLSIEMCRNIAKFGYRQSKGGRFIPKYDTKMSSQIEKSEYTTEEFWDMIKNVACPTLIIRGKESPFVSLEETQRMCIALPNATFEEIPRATHMPAQENPEAFKKVVLDYLDKK